MARQRGGGTGLRRFDDHHQLRDLQRIDPQFLFAGGGLSGGKCELDVTQTGGVYVDRTCVVDGNLVSAGTWHDYGSRFFKLFVEKMRAAAEK